jgi:hypothetical protein
MMQKNWIHYTLAALFFLFGLVQYNDPDFYIWMPAYFIVASIPFAYAKYFFPEKSVIMLLVVWLIWLGSYLPEIIDWFKQGRPSIWESMQAESPYIELIREFFGLLLSAITFASYLIFFKKRNK